MKFVCWSDLRERGEILLIFSYSDFLSDFLIFSLEWTISLYNFVHLVKYLIDKSVWRAFGEKVWRELGDEVVRRPNLSVYLYLCIPSMNDLYVSLSMYLYSIPIFEFSFMGQSISISLVCIYLRISLVCPQYGMYLVRCLSLPLCISI